MTRLRGPKGVSAMLLQPGADWNGSFELDMATTDRPADNREGLDRFDPVHDAGFAAAVQAFSDRFRRVRGRQPILLSETGPSERIVPGVKNTATVPVG